MIKCIGDFKIGKFSESGELLREKGASIGVIDEMIAGMCKALNSTLVTRNVKHFSRISGLKIEVW